MKPTLLLATLPMILASSPTFAKSEVEILRSLCAEQQRQIRQLEAENTQLRSVTPEVPAPAAKLETPAAAAPEPSPPATAASTTTYTVKAGDSLEKIANKLGESPAALAKLNGLKSSSTVKPGQKLKVPDEDTAAAAPVLSQSAEATQGTYKLKEGETFSSIAKKHKIRVETLIAANPKANPSKLRPGQIISLGRTAPTASKTTPAPAPPSEASSPAVTKSAPAVTTSAEPEKAAALPGSEKKYRTITVDGEMTYGEFATKYGTDAERLNALNGLDLTTATILAKGSELYVPNQP